jgi:hypothetical protein
MALLDTGEPFGLPHGTVRGTIAIVSLFLVAYSYVTAGTIDSTLLAFAGPYLGFYFGSRANEPAVVPEEQVADPDLGDAA